MQENLKAAHLLKVAKYMAVELRQKEEYRIEEKEDSKTQQVANMKQGDGDSLAEELDSVQLGCTVYWQRGKKAEREKRQNNILVPSFFLIYFKTLQGCENALRVTRANIGQQGNSKGSKVSSR